jgi:hypothetical protein
MKKMIAVAFLCGISTLSFADSVKFDPAEASANGMYHIAGTWSQLKTSWDNLDLNVVDDHNQPVAGATVTIKYQMVGMPMGTPDRPVVDKGDGVYEKQVFLGMRGKWQFDVLVNKGSTQDSLTHFQDVAQ